MVRQRRPYRPLLALVLLFGWIPAARAEGWPVPRGPSHEPEPYLHDGKKPPAVPREFLEDAAACVLYAGNTYLVEADGTLETITHEVTRFNGRKGIDKLGEYRNIAYDPAYQKLTLNEARVHKAGGAVVEVEPRHLQLRDVSTDYQVYDHEKQLIISFPSLEVGDVIEVKWTVRGNNPEHAGQFFTRYSFGDPTYPVVRRRVPRPPAAGDRPFKYRHGGRQDRPGRKEGGRPGPSTPGGRPTAATCRRTTTSRPRRTLRPSVACSTFASWDEVARWKQRLRADCWECTAAVRELVKEVTKGLKTPEEKARALTYWLRQNIRYVSVGREARLHAAYSRGGAGQPLRRLQGHQPAPGRHAARGRHPGGPGHPGGPRRRAGPRKRAVALGDARHPAGHHRRQGPLDRHDRQPGRLGLPAARRPRPAVLRRGRQGQAAPAAHAAAVGRRLPGRADHRRLGRGRRLSRCRRVAVYHGSAGMGQRDNFLEVPGGERRRLVTSELQDSNNRTRLVHLDIDDRELREFDRPVTVSMAYEIPGHFTGSSDKEGSVSDSKVWGKLLANTLDYERTAPFYLGSPFDLRHRYVIHLPPAFVLETTPQNRQVRSAWGTFTRTVRPGDDPERRWRSSSTRASTGRASRPRTSTPSASSTRKSASSTASG